MVAKEKWRGISLGKNIIVMDPQLARALLFFDGQPLL